MASCSPPPQSTVISGLSLFDSSDEECGENPFLGEFVSDEEVDGVENANGSGNKTCAVPSKRAQSFWREIPGLKLSSSVDRAGAVCALPYWKRYVWTCEPYLGDHSLKSASVVSLFVTNCSPHQDSFSSR